MAFDQGSRPLRLVIQGVDPTTILLTHFSGKEAISQTYAFDLSFVAEVSAPVKFEDVLGKSANVQIAAVDGRTRFFTGIISWLSQGKRDNRFQYYQAQLVPPLALFDYNVRSRIFQDHGQQTVPEILKAVLAPAYTPDMKKVSGTYPERTFTVQYRESDFAFASRLMEDEGISYYFAHTDGDHNLILADKPDGHLPLPLGSELLYEGVDFTNEGRITEWTKAQNLRIGAYQLRDHNFELPTNSLETLAFPIDTVKVGTVDHNLSLGPTADSAVVDSPGGYGWWLDGISPGGSEEPRNVEGLFDESARVADLRMRFQTSASLAIQGASTYRWLTPGYKFQLVGHFDGDGEYVLTSVTHEAVMNADASPESADAFKYSNTFECLPIDIPFLPEQVTERPTIRGTQTADVVGSEGEEIDPDKYGRVKVHFRWDPLPGRNLKTSCWVRVAQFWAGRNWGAQFIPRVGDEVIVAFVEGDPDRPIIIGSVYHADNLPIYKLPEHKTQSGIRTHTPLGSTANYNEIMFEDKKGQELVSIHAERNMNLVVENCYSQNVGTYAAHSGSDTKTTGTSSTKVYGDTSVTVTHGDYALTVNKGKITETAEKTIEITSNTDFIHLTSPTEIKLTVGGSFVQITPDTITLHAAHVKIEGGTDTKIVTPDLDANGTSKIFIHGPSTKVQGTSDCKLLGGTIDITGDTRTTAQGAASKLDLVAAGATMSGATSKVHGDGITTIEGSMVKVNC